MATYTNLSISQGWFEVGSVQTMPMGRTPVLVINGWIYTTDCDGLEKCFDEHHPVVISGRPAEAILDITRKLNDKYPHLRREWSTIKARAARPRSSGVPP